MIPEFIHIISLPAGILVNLVLTLLFYRYRTYIIKTDDLPEHLVNWSLPVLSDFLKAGIIWVFLIALLPSLELGMTGLMMIGFLGGVLNTLFMLQLNGMINPAFGRMAVWVIILSMVQCTLSTVVMGVMIQNFFMPEL
ncbi:MAG: hypothetical protein HUU10_07400 [Bacteroidetes bacterium]|nr:hypothetical protein [Bacteroidota bacterium]